MATYLLPPLVKTARPMAYVYRLTHKESGQFYYGYRKRNVAQNHTAAEDIGVFYFTSSKYINRENFNEYEVLIVAEFADARDAFILEQDLLENALADALLLNRQLQKYFNTTRKFNYAFTPEVIIRRTESRIRNNRPLSLQAIENMSNAQKRRFQSPEQINRAVNNLKRGWSKKIDLARKVIVGDPTGKEITFANVREFGRHYGLKRRSAYWLCSRTTDKLVQHGKMKGFSIFIEER